MRCGLSLCLNGRLRVTFPPEILAANLTAVLLVVIALGPDNILAISRSLS